MDQKPPPRPKPTVFICSSTEGIALAESIRQGLASVADAVLWTAENVFKLGDTFLDSLLHQADKADFAVVLLTPDDAISSRKQRFRSPRDNAVFEAGLFIGRLGRKRTFLVAPDTAQLKLPTDVAGLNIAKYRLISNQALGSDALPVLKRAILDCGLRKSETPRLGLSECRSAVLTLLAGIHEGEQIEIDWLGLDMSIACDYIGDLLDTDLDHHFFIRLLAMSGDAGASERREDPAEVRQWRTYVDGSLLRLKLRAQPLIDIRTARKLKTKLVAKSYYDVPTVHGILLKKPVQRAFVSLCYFDAKSPHHYTWGEFRYCMYDPQGEHSAGSMLLAEAFVGFFGRRWPEGSETWALEG